MDKNMLTVLTSEDRDEIRKALKDIIIEQIKEDISNNDYYLIDNSELQDFITEVMEDVKNDIRPIIYDILMKDVKNKFNIE